MCDLLHWFENFQFFVFVLLVTHFSLLPHSINRFCAEYAENKRTTAASLHKQQTTIAATTTNVEKYWCEMNGQNKNDRFKQGKMNFIDKSLSIIQTKMKLFNTHIHTHKRTHANAFHSHRNLERSERTHWTEEQVTNCCLLRKISNVKAGDQPQRRTLIPFLIN